MKRYILSGTLTITLMLFSSTIFSQTLELGALSSFEAYTGKGAVTNSGTFTGDAGTNDGIIAGFAGPTFNGKTENNNALTVQARIDLLRIYIHLIDVFVAYPGTHAPAFGAGETISPGVYSVDGAGSVTGALTLDGGGDPNAYFILRFNGALTVEATSTIILSGGTRAANVFWIAEGAIEVGANCTIKGTLFSHPGAITLGVNSTIEGRLISVEGAITTAAGSVSEMPLGPINIPIKCLGNCSSNPLVDVLGSLSTFALFTNNGAVTNNSKSGIVGNIGTNIGDITGFGTSTHVGFFTPGAKTAQAKIDLDTYNLLINLTNTELGHTPAFGTGETVYPGVYYTGGAGSLSGTITLDAQGDSNAIFVFKFNGAFSVAAQSKVILTNGARRCNIFWISEGATDMGTFTVMKGNVLAHAGAITMGAGGNLEGRLLSTAGAIEFSTGVVYNDTLCFGDDTPISNGNQTVCSDDTITQSITAAATSNTTNGVISWYDAATDGNEVSDPSQVGLGSITYYAESFNGTYSSIRVPVTLTIRNCINAVDDNFNPIFESGGNTISSVLINDTLNGASFNPLDITLTPGTAPIPTLGNLIINTNGTITVSPGTTPGTYNYPYTICVNTDLTNCNTAIATVLVVGGIPMITQVYQSGDERWIEVTNIHSTNSITENLINIQLYQNKTGGLTDIEPSASYSIGSILAPGKSILFKNITNSITNIDGNTTVLTNNDLTDFAISNNTITISSKSDSTSYAFRYDLVNSFTDKTSLVRIDKTSAPNKTFAASEWVLFIDDNLNRYRDLNLGGPERHPHDPLISEITGANINANTLLGLHRTGITTRTGSNWSNGFPDRSRFVVIDDIYNHTDSRLSARQLTVNNSKRLSVTNNLLVVTDSILLNGEIRLVGLLGKSKAQLIQTHTGTSLVSGTGKLLVDQNSKVPSEFRYNYMGSPVRNNIGSQTYTVAGVFKDGTTPTNATGTVNSDIAKDITFVGGYDGSITNPISLADFWIYTYAASEGRRAGWVQEYSSGSIAITDGFIFKGPGRAQNYTFAGTPNDGLNSTTIGEDESYLLANPFPSAISVKKFIEDNINSIGGTLYFWQHVEEEDDSSSDSSGHNYGGYIGGYATRNIGMGVAANQTGFSSEGTHGTEGSGYKTPRPYIVIGQGFFVSGDTTDGGSIVFNNSQREFITEENINKSVFFKGAKASKTKKEENNLPIIKLGMDYLNEEGISFHRQIGISFNPNNSFAFDKGYDSPIYDLGATDMYWKMPNSDSKYVIAGVQEIKDNLEIPLEIIMSFDGIAEIQIDEVQAINRDVYLKDKITNIDYLLNGEKVAIQLPEGTHTDRFYLAFGSQVLSNNNNVKLLDTTLKIYANSNNRSIVISKNEDLNIINIGLYNLLGKKVTLWDIKQQKNTHQLEIKTRISSGVYIVKLNTNKGIINKKIIFK